MATGTATLDFGATPGTNHVSVAVTGQASIGANDHVEAFIMGNDSTATHNAYEHMVAPIKLSVSSVVAATGFTINAVTDWRLDGTFKCRWAWSA
jgi:hypothetical protein